MVTKWTNIKSVLFELERFIPKDLYSEQRLVEDCMRAVDFIGSVPTYQVSYKFIKVENYKACLPIDCLQIIQVAYKNDFCLTNSDILALANISHGCNDPECNECQYCSTSTYNFNINDIQSQTVISNNWLYKSWTPLRLSTNSFSRAVHTDNCVNFTSNCVHEYNVNPDGSMVFSFQSGYICVSYYCYPSDCDGVPLIPDIEDYKEALKNYCLMNSWELRWNMKEEGAGERYMKYQQLWGLYKAKANASVRMPDVAEAENLKNIHTKFIPNTRRFNNFFATLNSEEHIDFGGFLNHFYYRN